MRRRLFESWVLTYRHIIVDGPGDDAVRDGVRREGAGGLGELRLRRHGRPQAPALGIVMVLGWSRAIYVEFVRRADVASFMQCRVNAF